MLNDNPAASSIDRDGWALVSAEDRHSANPETFEIPPRERRESIVVGEAAKLLFDIQTTVDGQVVDRGVDRMWVIVSATTNDGYLGILDNNPGESENLTLRRGGVVAFGPEHVASIDTPPKEYVIELLGESAFERGAEG